MHSTLSERLDALAKNQGKELALIEPERSVTFGELSDQIHRLAGYLANRGVRAGDRVALWLPNNIEWVTSFVALSHLGAIALLVNTRFRSRELQDLIERGQATHLIYWPGFKGIAFDEILDDISPTVRQQLNTTITFAELRAAIDKDWPVIAAHGDHGTLTFTTSGTTSLPKFVLHTESVILRHADAIAKAFAYDSETCVLASAPFCGAFGFATLIGGLFTGHRVACEPVSTAESLLNLVRQQQVTHTYANNALILQMLKASNDPGDFTSCKLFGFASFAPAQDELFELAKRNHLPLTGLYGSSELIALTAAQPTDPSQGDTSVRYEPGGRLVHENARVRARDPETGHLLANGESGEIEILSPSHMAGYLDQSEATRKAFTDDGYFKTGDLGWCVSDRQFVFQARMGDSLRLGGFLVNPAEIETVVESLPGVAAAQVVAADLGAKSVAVAFVLLKDTTESTPDAWQAECKRQLAGFKVPVHFEVLESFPTVESANSVKIQKHKLREMAQQLLDKQHA
ncbi:MAG: AMP-binding protein [Burkholderiaceae bacterium]|nr:AMP-binding protein [Burkholderiaceae bacterium]MCD8517575.1 AMP-binding protein [Burkholderiaceae bacterium]MCD8537370.1 AMP-binding protein [Burkholderiaceae bacterium]MCD8564587.1 AMP-binding protein [Burkholderiaceae bacterium]